MKRINHSRKPLPEIIYRYNFLVPTIQLSRKNASHKNKMANITVTDRTYCITLPPKISSKGIGVPGYQKGHVLQYGLPQLELQMITIFVFTQVCYFILKPFRLPAFVSQLLVRPLILFLLCSSQAKVNRLSVINDHRAFPENPIHFLSPTCSSG